MKYIAIHWRTAGVWKFFDAVPLVKRASRKGPVMWVPAGAYFV